MVLSGFAAARFAGVSRSLRPAKWSPRESRYCINIGDALNNMFLTHLRWIRVFTLEPLHICHR